MVLSISSSIAAIALSLIWWLASLARRPTEGELNAAKHLLVRDRKTGFEDVQWALLNSPEFLVNH